MLSVGDSRSPHTVMLRLTTLSKYHEHFIGQSSADDASYTYISHHERGTSTQADHESDTACRRGFRQKRFVSPKMSTISTCCALITPHPHNRHHGDPERHTAIMDISVLIIFSKDNTGHSGTLTSGSCLLRTTATGWMEVFCITRSTVY